MITPHDAISAPLSKPLAKDTTPPPPLVSKPIAYAMLLCAALFWGSGNVANKTVLEHIGPFSAVGLRCLLASAVLLPFACFERHGGRIWPWAQSAFGLSWLFAGAVSVQQWAFQSATVTNASFLINTCSVLTPVLAWLVLGERQPRRVAFAATLTVIGAYSMSVGAGMAQMNSGDAACLLSAVFYAGWMVALGRHAMTHGRAFATTFVHCAVTAAVMLPGATYLETPSTTQIVAALPELLFLGVFSTAAALGLTAIAQAHVSSTVAAVLVSAESLFGGLSAAVFLGERPPAAALVGAALILTAILIVALDGGCPEIVARQLKPKPLKTGTACPPSAALIKTAPVGRLPWVSPRAVVVKTRQDSISSPAT